MKHFCYLVIALILSVPAFGQIAQLNPELYFLVESDSASVFDKGLRSVVIDLLDQRLDLDSKTRYVLSTDEKVGKTALSSGLGVLAYKGIVLLVLGDAAPPHVIQLEKDIDIILRERGYAVQRILTSQLVSDDLSKHVLFPKTNITFVVDDTAQLSDVLLTSHLEDYAGYILLEEFGPFHFKTLSELNDSDLPRQIVLYAENGRIIISVGNQTPAHYLNLSYELGRIINGTHQDAKFSLGNPHLIVVSNTSTTKNDLKKALANLAPLPSLPDLLLVRGDPFTPSDEVLARTLAKKAISRSYFSLSPTLLQFTDQDINRSHLENRVTLVVSKSDAMLVVGASSPPWQVILAYDLSNALYDEYGINAESKTSREVISDNLSFELKRQGPTPPSDGSGLRNPELLFVSEDKPLYADQATLKQIFAEMNDPSSLTNTINNYAFKKNGEILVSDLDYRVTIFASQGGIAIITGTHSPPSHKELADRIEQICKERLGILPQRLFSEQVFFSDLRFLVYPSKKSFNSLTFAFFAQPPFLSPSQFSFHVPGPDGNTSGRIVVSFSDIQNGIYFFGEPSMGSSSHGYVEVINGSIKDFSFDVFRDKIQTFSLRNDSIIKEYFFSDIGNRSVSNATMNITFIIDRIANFSVAYKTDLMQGTLIKGGISLDPTNAYPRFIPVQQFSLKGKIFQPHGNLFGDGTLLAQSNLGKFYSPIFAGKYFATVTHEAQNDHIFYRIGGLEAFNSTVPPDNDTPIVLDHDLMINQSQRGALPPLNIPRKLQFPHFADEDIDGVPEQIDICPSTNVPVIDIFGCSCSQKNCAKEQKGCIEKLGTAQCQETCTDGFQNGQETGVDCGVACGKGCSAQACTTPGSCLFESQPAYCNGQLDVVSDCKQCGCPLGQLCTGKGTCSRTPPASCYNNILDGDETALDCGGSCGPCPGEPCFISGCSYIRPFFCESPPLSLGERFVYRASQGTYYQASTVAGRKSLADAVLRGGLNTLFIDAKTEDGKFGYNTSLNSPANIAWPEGEPLVEMISLLHSAGPDAGARVSVGQDKLWIQQHTSDALLPNSTWVNLCSTSYRDYISSIVKEIAQKKADIIMLDFFRGPDIAEGSLGPITCTDNTTYSSLLVSFAQRLTQEAHNVSAFVRVSAAVFGRSARANQSDPTGQTATIGQAVDLVQPLLYTSQLEPGKTIESYVDDFTSAGISIKKIVPWIQGFAPHDNSRSILSDINALDSKQVAGFSIWWMVTLPPDSMVWDQIGLVLLPKKSPLLASLNCKECGCPKGFTCTEKGSCKPETPTVNTCENGILDGDEREIDCGGSCEGFCPIDQCRTPDQCLGAQPIFCSTNYTLSTNCEECGCPPDFTCESDGECRKAIETQNKQCLTGQYFVLGGGGTCPEATNDTSFRAEPASSYVSYDVLGNLPSWMGGGDVKNDINHALKQTTLCFAQQDLGCSLTEITCDQENQTDNIKAEIQQSLQSYFSGLGRRQIPGILKNWPFGFNSRAKVDISPLKISSTSSCPRTIINSTAGDENNQIVSSLCAPIIFNGEPSTKLDILFISDGIAPFEKVTSLIDNIMDYDSVRKGTDLEGIFSVEPFASKKSLFNVWVLPTPKPITYEENPFVSRSGEGPVVGEVVNMSNLCPQRDMTIFITEKPFRSACFFGLPGPCLISLAQEKFPGRLVLHELGHGLGKLSDEYFERLELTGTDPLITPKGLTTNALFGPNCKESEQTAQQTWGDLIGGQPEIGFFKTCGGPCTDDCKAFIRPTLNSVMHYQTCSLGQAVIGPEGNIQNCRSIGPPFEPYYGINQRQIETIIGNFTDT